MGLRFGVARAISAASTWGLKNVFHRPAANFPGKIALYADPRLIADLSDRMTEGSVLVVGTNGKTTVTNMLADALELSGRNVVCNRTGANLDSGVATALLHTPPVEWGVFECDELWLAKILPFTQSRYVVLLNLFRDQLDRAGEIDHIQQSITKALSTSPDTVLVYNADDPLCQKIADGVSNITIPFGVAGDMRLDQDTTADARMCQHCSTLLEYDYRQYNQLGKYHCPNCDFKRADLACTATNAKVGDTSVSFDALLLNQSGHADVPFAGAYMVYNALAVYVAADLVGVPFEDIAKAIDDFDPKNGRLQRYELDGMDVLLNLAKNPTGFNQNLNIVSAGEGPKAVAFFVNDKEADGRDVSWLWDVDFQKLADIPDLVAYAGGLRGADVQVALKYAGVNAQLVEDPVDVLSRVKTQSPDAKVFIISNYTALPGAKAALDKMESDGANIVASEIAREPKQKIPTPADGRPFVIEHMFPTLLNLYGDNGNVEVLAQRLRWRGIPVDVRRVEDPNEADLEQADIVFIGGGPDREQHEASAGLAQLRDKLVKYVEDDGVLLAICGGYQIIGNEWLMGDESVPGLGLVDVATKRAEGGSHNRLVGNIVLKSALSNRPVVGFENHAGRTYLGGEVEVFGNVVGSAGNGNNDNDHADGAMYKNLVGSYLHGPLLSKNPEVADALIERAIARREKTAANLAPLDDAVEVNANMSMCKKLGVE